MLANLVYKANLNSTLPWDSDTFLVGFIIMKFMVIYFYEK